MVKYPELTQILEFLKVAEKLKDTLRSGHTSQGRTESVAEHTWRLCLMVAVFHRQYFPELDFSKLIKMCLIHDLGEAINGDIPAPQQSEVADKSVDERKDLLLVLAPLPEELKNEFIQLWDEYEAVSSQEARLAKALDKMETIIQHNQGANPEGFDYGFNVEYGRKYAEYNEVISTFRLMVDEETRGNSNKQKK